MMKARMKWVEKLQFVGNAPSGHSILIDGAEAGGGDDSAVHPMELILLGAGGCTGMDAVSIMKKMKLQVTSFELDVEGERKEDHPKGYSSVKITYRVTGRDLPEDKVRHAIELSQDKYCGVSDSLRSEVDVSWDLELEEDG